MMRKRIPHGAKVPVPLTLRDRRLIREHTFYDLHFAKKTLAQGRATWVSLSLDEIEDIQGFVAAEANHCDDRELEDELDALFEKLQIVLDSYEEQNG